MHCRLGCLPAGGLNRLPLRGKKYVSAFKYVLEAVSRLEEAFQACLCLLAGTSLVLGKDAASHTEWFPEKCCIRMEAVSGS